MTERLRQIRVPLAWWAVSRIVVLASAWFADLTAPSPISLAEILGTGWDGSWYALISTDGYVDSVPEVDGRAVANRLAFFPLLPALARGVRVATGLAPELSILVVNLLASLAAVLVVWALVRRVTDEKTADRVAALFAFFPGAYVLSMGYSEALMIALAAGALLAVRDDGWVLAGVLAALCTATRPSALAIVPALLVAAELARRQGKGLRPFVAPALAPLGAATFVVHLRRITGSWDAWPRTQNEGWNHKVDVLAQWDQAWAAVTEPTRYPHFVVSTLLLAFLSWAAWRCVRDRMPLDLLTYMAFALFLVLGNTGIGPRPRFVLAAFPLLIGAAARLSETRFRLLLQVSGGLMVLCGVASFMTWPNPRGEFIFIP